MRRSKPRRSALAALNKLYRELPNVQCKGLCFNTCSNVVPMLRIEQDVIKEYRSLPMEPMFEPLRTKNDGGCKYLSEDNRCMVHQVRPLICRLFGLVDHGMMICHHGCPVTGRLTDREAKRILEKLNKIQARLDEAEGVKEPVLFELSG